MMPVWVAGAAARSASPPSNSLKSCTPPRPTRRPSPKTMKARHGSPCRAPRYLDDYPRRDPRPPVLGFIGRPRRRHEPPHRHPPHPRRGGDRPRGVGRAPRVVGRHAHADRALSPSRPSPTSRSRGCWPSASAARTGGQTAAGAAARRWRSRASEWCSRPWRRSTVQLTEHARGAAAWRSAVHRARRTCCARPATSADGTLSWLSPLGWAERASVTWTSAGGRCC